MTPTLYLRMAIEPALRLLPAVMESAEARAMMLAVALQETRLLHRRQVPSGIAHGYAQFEAGPQAAIAGILQHSATSLKAIALCQALDIRPTVIGVYDAIEFNDVLCAGFSRLLLWTLPSALPGPQETTNGWNQYLMAWRPGRPHRDTWDSNYAAAWNTVLQGRPLPSVERV